MKSQQSLLTRERQHLSLENQALEMPVETVSKSLESIPMITFNDTLGLSRILFEGNVQ